MANGWVAIVVQVVDNDMGFKVSRGLPMFFLHVNVQMINLISEERLRPIVEGIVGKHDEVHFTFADVD